jgi:hypothetical protein
MVRLLTPNLVASSPMVIPPLQRNRWISLFLASLTLLLMPPGWS